VKLFDPPRLGSKSVAAIIHDAVKDQPGLVLTPPPESDGDGVASRRLGARHGVSMRVRLKSASGATLDGWALNVSRGGVRVILAEKVTIGSVYQVALSTGADPVAACSGRVVWVQEEPDGVVCGIELVE
jgi:hypothetical protein